MKILQLEVEGFRSLKHVVWKPGDLNVVIGPNASGKSNLLKVLEMLKAAAEGRLKRHVMREGGMGSLVWDAKVEDIVFGLNLSEGVDYRLALRRLGDSSSYGIASEECHDSLECREDELGISSANFKGSKAKPNEETRLSQQSCHCDERVGSYLASWGLYQDFVTARGSVVRSDTIAMYESHVDPDGSNLIPTLHTLYTGNRSFKEDVNDAMAAAFGDDFDELIFAPVADQRIVMRVRWKSLATEQPAANLSDGTLRFLYLLAVLADPEPPGLIAIDEPETGLHPRMMALVAELAVHAARRTQVILTTHSSDFLDGFYKLGSPTVSVAENRGGETLLRVLEGEELQYWLKRYTLGDLFRTTELEQME